MLRRVGELHVEELRVGGLRVGGFRPPQVALTDLHALGKQQSISSGDRIPFLLSVEGGLL